MGFIGFRVEGLGFRGSNGFTGITGFKGFIGLIRVTGVCSSYRFRVQGRRTCRGLFFWEGRWQWRSEACDRRES